MSGPPLLELDRVTVRYGPVEALCAVSLEVAAGEVVVVVGANGAGKTTALRAVSGLVQPASGDIRFEGRSLLPLRAHEIAALGIGHVPEGRRIFAGLTVLENLELGAYLQHGPSHDDLEQTFARFPRLADRRGQQAGTLSGGEQQMLAMGRALIGRPRLLLLDEPSLGLAPRIIDDVFDTIREVSAEGTTVLLVEQNAAAALQLAGRGYLLDAGAVALTATSRRMLRDDRVRAAYLGE